MKNKNKNKNKSNKQNKQKGGLRVTFLKAEEERERYWARALCQAIFGPRALNHRGSVSYLTSYILHI